MCDLRQQVRRDDDLPPMSRLLFAEIWQMNEGDGECYAEDDWLGEQIGAAESTVRKHRLTLRQKGYIKQSKSGGLRYLEPNEMINIDHSDQKRSESNANDEQSDQNRSEEVINSDQHKGCNNPEATRGSAPAREETVDEDLSIRLVKIWRSVRSAPSLNARRENVLFDWAESGTVTDPALFREVLEEQAADTTAKGSGMSMGILLKEYKKRRDAGKLRPDRQDDPDWIIDEQGRKCYKGVPVENIGCKNLAADLQDDHAGDGTAGREPEVVAHG